MRVMNTLYVDDHDVRIGVRRGAIEIRRARALCARFPMATIEQLVLTGRAQITSEALARCSRDGVRVASLHRSGRVRFVVGAATSGNVLLRVAQVRAFDDQLGSAELARSFVAGKLQNQMRLVSRWRSRAAGHVAHHLDEQREVIAERLGQLGDERDGDRIRGLEGDATRRYFKALGAHLDRAGSPYPFVSRTRRPPRDPANALLSYLYGLLVVEVTGAADAVGLDPQIGFLHRLRPGRPSLALDLVEELRPAFAERFAVTLLARHQLGDHHFSDVPGGACHLSDDGRKFVLARWEEFRSQTVEHPLLRAAVPRSTVATIQATLLARTLRGDLPTYPPYVAG